MACNVQSRWHPRSREQGKIIGLPQIGQDDCLLHVSAFAVPTQGRLLAHDMLHSWRTTWIQPLNCIHPPTWCTRLGQRDPGQIAGTGVAKMTADMVRLGLLGTVHDIVVTLCAQDRADAVAAVTAELLKQGEVVIVTRITNALVASGHAGEAVSISGEQASLASFCLCSSVVMCIVAIHVFDTLLESGERAQELCALLGPYSWRRMPAGELIKQGNTQIYEVIKESGLDMGMLGGDNGGKQGDDKEGGASGSQEEGSSSGVLENIQRKGAQVRLLIVLFLMILN